MTTSNPAKSWLMWAGWCIDSCGFVEGSSLIGSTGHHHQAYAMRANQRGLIKSRSSQVQVYTGEQQETEKKANTLVLIKPE